LIENDLNNFEEYEGVWITFEREYSRKDEGIVLEYIIGKNEKEKILIITNEFS